jgi:acyl-coenzyme A thioesterase PaaI-like protein
MACCGVAEDPAPLDEESVRAWTAPEPGRLMGRGHPAGDFLEAWRWEVLVEELGHLRVSCHLPAQVLNPRGQLFGGFTPTYVDMIALRTVRAGQREGWGDQRRRAWMATTNMRIDYFEPILGPRFEIDSVLEKSRGRTRFVTSRFFQDDVLAVYSVTTIREVALDRPLGDA